ncbi:hypothetical protein KPH14_012101 [Odynerus spinipes]|uniref:C2H2-type domain-containing protein n=1 Tax=Odynerus spinipes TaxID=1348599 RepID=A0AAD9R9Q6_9HYME|nr:hypothetical protein KPH14_012101 [Odynerus spinipes]
MSCYAQGRCHFCSQKHALTVFGSKEPEHNLMQKANLNLIVLNTVCSSCINLLDSFIKSKIIKSAHQKEIPQEKNTINTISKSNIYVQCTQKEYKNCNNSTVNKECQTEDIPYKTEYVILDHVNTSKTNNTKKKSLLCLHCDFCRKQFNHIGDLNKHRRRHTKEKPYSCRVCQQQFSNASNLARHQRMHSGERPFLCEKCQCSFFRKDKLSQHLLSKHCTVKSSIDM